MVTFGNAQIHYQKIPVHYQTRPWHLPRNILTLVLAHKRIPDLLRACREFSAIPWCSSPCLCSAQTKCCDNYVCRNGGLLFIASCSRDNREWRLAWTWDLRNHTIHCGLNMSCGRKQIKVQCHRSLYLPVTRFLSSKTSSILDRIITLYREVWVRSFLYVLVRDVLCM